jgi:cation transport protein ChaC
LWIFGYGSLMWNPGFPHLETRQARLFGFHRNFCIKSEHYRGRPGQPGLVLGLDRGGSCLGLAFRVASGDEDVALPYLWAREMVTKVYRPARVTLRLLDASVDTDPHGPPDSPSGSPPRGATVKAFTFVARRDHRQYCGGLPEPEMCAILATASGKAGPNRDYLRNTVEHLAALGLPDRRLARLAERVMHADESQARPGGTTGLAP